MAETPNWSLGGKVAIVTGTAPGGIGAAYASALAEAGASVVCADISEAGAAAVAASLNERGLRAAAATVDIGVPDSVEAMVETAVSTFGGVDILVNNAALMAQLPKTPILDYSIEDLDRAFEVNFKGAFLCARATASQMAERGGGRIINQVSASAYPPATVYGITKLALVGLTTALARELGPKKITVNAIAPGLTDSDAGKGLIPDGSEAREQMVRATAIQSSGSPADLTGALLLLASPAGAWISGQTLHVDGGWVLRP